MRPIDADILADEIESLKVSIAGRPATWDEAKADILQVIGECPSVAVESTLSQILQENVPGKYSLSAKACEGILRRAERRGKELPPMLKAALEYVISQSA